MQPSQEMEIESWKFKVHKASKNNRDGYSVYRQVALDAFLSGQATHQTRSNEKSYSPQENPTSDENNNMERTKTQISVVGSSVKKKRGRKPLHEK